MKIVSRQRECPELFVKTIGWPVNGENNNWRPRIVDQRIGRDAPVG